MAELTAEETPMAMSPAERRQLSMRSEEAAAEKGYQANIDFRGAIGQD